MRHAAPLEMYVLSAVTGALLMASVFLTDAAAFGAEPQTSGPPCTCADPGKSVRPKFADLNNRDLDEQDEAAALESIQVGLSSMHDGEPFVWRRPNGRLSGIVRPTVSFRNAKGLVCRHVVVLLTTGFKTRSAEGVACRSADRRWVLEG